MDGSTPGFKVRVDTTNGKLGGPIKKLTYDMRTNYQNFPNEVAGLSCVLCGATTTAVHVYIGELNDGSRLTINFLVCGSHYANTSAAKSIADGLIGKSIHCYLYQQSSMGTGVASYIAFVGYGSCSKCNGSGKVTKAKNCTHGKSSSHWYCSHGTAQSANYHT